MNKQLIALLSCTTLLGACATHGINTDRSELDGARQAVSQARQAGAETCAPKLMAKAQAELYWAAHELTEGVHPDENAMHIAHAEKFAMQAKDKADKECHKPVEVIALTGVNFKTNSAELTPASTAILDAAVATLNKRSNIRVEIGAHTDSRGQETYNQQLSEKRAMSVGDYLVSHGINADRLAMHGYGEAKPIADNATAEGRAQNRRVELTVLN
ncbi:MAG: OmpA family protein [Mariprofundaceae bacterium]|nr:OmpA family protein [Mariprofundaceae bacterium]